jgi:hypothetical protein
MATVERPRLSYDREIARQRLIHCAEQFDAALEAYVELGDPDEVDEVLWEAQKEFAVMRNRKSRGDA